jgi:regulatory protein
MYENLFEEALSYAASCCSRSELCEADILRKITLFQLTEQEQTDLIARLKEMGFIDSERYARAYVSDKFRFQHWGRIKISYQLKQKDWRKRVSRRRSKP